MAQGKDPVTRGNGGGARTHEIEMEIDRTRAAMDRTVDAIAGKLTPQQLMVEALGVFKDGSSALASRLVQTAREHPVPATIIGIGIGLLLTESAKGESADRGDDARHVGFGRAPESYGTGVATTVGEGAAAAVKERVGETAGYVKEEAAHVKDQVLEQAVYLKDQVAEKTVHARESADHLREKVGETAGRVRTQAAQVPVAARRQWHDAKLGFWQTMDQRPFAIGAAALAAGVAAGLTVPSSRKEQELMGETRDRLLDQAKGLTRDAMDKGRQVARIAGDVVKSEAERVAFEPLRATGMPMGAGDETLPGGAAGRGMTAGFAAGSPAPMGSSGTGTGTETTKK